MEQSEPQVELASSWKEKGNQYFKDKNYEEAINCYTKAINIDPSVSIYFSNRSRMYKIIGDLENSLKDALQATETDESNIKAHLLGGQVLATIGKNEENVQKIELAIKRMTKALTLCAGQDKQDFEDDLNKYIMRAKKLLWYVRNKQSNERYQEIKADLIERIKDKYPEEDWGEKISNIPPPPPKRQPIPDYYLCKISKKILQNPVTTLYSDTYEKKVLQYLLQSNMGKDEQGRSVKQNYWPNINLKQAIDHYLQEEAWAYEYTDNEDWKNIEF